MIGLVFEERNGDAWARRVALVATPEAAAQQMAAVEASDDMRPCEWTADYHREMDAVVALRGGRPWGVAWRGAQVGDTVTGRCVTWGNTRTGVVTEVAGTDGPIALQRYRIDPRDGGHPTYLVSVSVITPR